MFGQAFANAGQAAGQGVSQYLKGQAENKKLSGLGFDVNAISDPRIREQVLQDQMTFGRKMKQSNIASEVNNEMYGNKLASGGQTQDKSLGTPQQPDQYGNFPEPETEGSKRRIETPEEVISTGLRTAALNRERGNNMSDEEGIAQARARNDEKRQYNQDVEADKQQRVTAQRDYGKKGADALAEVYPDATPEMQAKFKKMGEDAAKNNTSEALFEKQLAEEARKYKNMIANIKNSAQAPVLTEKLKRSILGNNRERQEAITDIRIQLEPLLKDGFYDSSRLLLAEKGYSPESVESIISDLGEGSRKTLAQLPEMKFKKFEKKGKGLFNPIPQAERIEESYAKTRENMQQVFEAEPSVNLTLLRKAYMEKGFDYRTFKNNLNEMIQNGEIQLNDEQFNQLAYLEEPPYNEAEQLIKGIKLID